MIQSKFSIEKSHADFFSAYKTHGFKDKSSMFRAAIELLMKEIEREKLKLSADIYSELYMEEEEIGELTESAMEGWPE